ncbi:hypothetical protein [Roseivivax sp. CAU 1753]
MRVAPYPDGAGATLQDGLDHASGAVALSQLLRRLASEMAQLEEQSLSVEHCMTALINRTEGQDEVSASLQNLDRLVQTLAELQGFLNRVADTVPEGVLVDLDAAASAVKLRKLSSNLMGRRHDDVPNDGTVDMF